MLKPPPPWRWFLRGFYLHPLLVWFLFWFLLGEFCLFFEVFYFLGFFWFQFCLFTVFFWICCSGVCLIRGLFGFSGVLSCLLCILSSVGFWFLDFVAFSSLLSLQFVVSFLSCCRLIYGVFSFFLLVLFGFCIACVSRLLSFFFYFMRFLS